jgi:CheY-like chemotaxis protein/HPt (histidine-containing phosphotransfer) domain-containing protein
VGKTAELAFLTMPDSQLFDTNMAKRHPINILLVDDNAVNLKVASIMLLRMGYEIDQATNGLEALSAQQKNRYDLIFMDIQMPEMDGVTATKQIFNTYSRAERPRIVALTAHAIQEDRERYLEAGMDGYISKPVRISRLIEEIEKTATKPLNLVEEITVNSSTNRLNPANLPVPFDTEMFAEMLGISIEDAEEMLPELIELFIEDAAIQIAKIDEAILIGNYSVLREAAHKLKGGAASIAAVQLTEACDALEKMGSNRQLDGAGLEFEQIKRGFYQLETWLAEYRSASNRKSV